MLRIRQLYPIDLSKLRWVGAMRFPWSHLLIPSRVVRLARGKVTRWMVNKKSCSGGSRLEKLPSGKKTKTPQLLSLLQKARDEMKINGRVFCTLNNLY